jgi:hypothetical protein
MCCRNRNRTPRQTVIQKMTSRIIEKKEQRALARGEIPDELPRNESSIEAARQESLVVPPTTWVDEKQNVRIENLGISDRGLPSYRDVVNKGV